MGDVVICIERAELYAGNSDSTEDDIRPHHQLPQDSEQHVPCCQGRTGGATEL